MFQFWIWTALWLAKSRVAWLARKTPTSGIITSFKVARFFIFPTRVTARLGIARIADCHNETTTIPIPSYCSRSSQLESSDCHAIVSATTIEIYSLLWETLVHKYFSPPSFLLPSSSSLKPPNLYTTTTNVNSKSQARSSKTKPTSLE